MKNIFLCRIELFLQKIFFLKEEKTKKKFMINCLGHKIKEKKIQYINLNTCEKLKVMMIKESSMNTISLTFI